METHVANRYAIVAAIPDDLVLQFLPPPQVLIDQDLIAHAEGLGREVPQLAVVFREAAAEPAERERRSHEDRVPDAVGDDDRLLNGVGAVGQRDALADLLKLLAEYLAILGGLDDGYLRPEDLHPRLLELPGIPQLDPDVQRRLPAHADDDPVRLLLVYDVHDHLGPDGEEVHPVGARRDLVLLRARLDGGDVGVDEYHLDALLLEGLDALTSGVIELACLADAQSTAPDQQDLLVGLLLIDESVLQHERLGDLTDVTDELVEKERRVEGPAARLRVELHREERLVGVYDPLVRQVVRVDEERLPVGGERVGIDREAVVLGSDVAPTGAQVDARLVEPTVAVLELVRAGAGREAQ